MKKITVTVEINEATNEVAYQMSDHAKLYSDYDYFFHCEYFVIEQEFRKVGLEVEWEYKFVDSPFIAKSVIELLGF